MKNVLILLLLASFATGEDLIKFRVEDVNCTDTSVQTKMICIVPDPYKGIKLYKDDDQVAFCIKHHGNPIPYCDPIHPHRELSVSRLINDTLIYTLESINEDFIYGQWVCRNGAKNDLSSSIFVPRINCNTKSKSLNDEITTALISLLLILVPLAACATQLYIHIQAERNKKRVIYSNNREYRNTSSTSMKEKWREHQIVFYLVSLLLYFVLCIIIYAIGLENDARIALTVVCCLISFVLFVVIPMRWTPTKKERNDHVLSTNEYTDEKPHEEERNDHVLSTNEYTDEKPHEERKPPEGGNPTSGQSKIKNGTEGVISNPESEPNNPDGLV